MKLEKLTLSYVNREDRIRLDGENKQQEVVTLWLTQRLANRLVPVISDWLRKQVPTGAHADKVQQYQQEAVAEERKKEPIAAVEVDESAVEWLIHAVDIGQSEHSLSLRFRGYEEGQQATLRLANDDMRQWFEILYRMYRVAGWQSDDWPVWMSHLSAEVPKNRVLH